MQFNLEAYEPVKDRITRFYSDHADGRIITELISSPTDLGSFAAFRALCYLDNTLKSTGYAYEAAGGKGANQDSWVENAETSAVGRALANMDYCGDLRPSREEMSKVKCSSSDIDSTSEITSRALAKELHKTEDEKAAMWKACAGNWSNLKIMLEAELAARITNKLEGAMK